MKEINVNSGKIKYKIYIANNFDAFDACLEENRINEKMLVVSDSRVLNLYGEEFKSRVRSRNAYTYGMAGGEKNKNLYAVRDIYDMCISGDFSRHSAIIALGGGVVGDTAGFAASTFMGGIRFIQVPTTIISDVDSSIGDSVEVNYGNVKDMIGTKCHPDFVYINTSVLKTLEKKQIISGIAEIIKYSILFSEEFFNYLNTSMNGLLSLESDKLNYTIRECIGFKLGAMKDGVEDDRERQMLNFGHTLGHAIELMSGYGVYHGEAVALGMMIESAVSYLEGMLQENTMLSIFKLIRRAGLGEPFEIENMEKFLEIVNRSRKHENGNLKFVLPEQIGRCSISMRIQNDKIVKAYEILKYYWRDNL